MDTQYWLAIVQLVTAIATAITVVAALIKSFSNGRKIEALTVNLDGNMDKLLALTASTNLAKGRADERSDVATAVAMRTANDTHGEKP